MNSHLLINALECSRDALRQTTLAASSVNLETVALVSDNDMKQIIAESEGIIAPDVPDQKIPVADLVIYDDPQGGGGKRARVVHSAAGRIQEICLKHLVCERGATGSSVNVAHALTQMGAHDTGILGAIGGGDGGRTLIESLRAHESHKLFLLQRTSADGRKSGTAQGLFLKTPDGKTVAFALKPPYDVDESSRAYLRENITSRIIVCTGFLPFEFELIRALMSTQTRPEARILSPHHGCFISEKTRQQCLALAEGATLFQINGNELRELLDLKQGWERASDQEIGDLLRQIPAQLVCITMDAGGSITYVRAQDRLLRHESGKPKQVNNPIGAGDIHLSALIWYLWLRERKIELNAVLQAAAWIAARKIEYAGASPRPWDGIPISDDREIAVHAAEKTFLKDPIWIDNNHAHA